MKTLMIFILMSTMTIAVTGGTIVNPIAPEMQTTELNGRYDSIYRTDNLTTASTANEVLFDEQIWFEAMKGENILLQTNILEDSNLLHVKIELSDQKAGTVRVKNENDDIVWSSGIAEDALTMEFYLDMNRFPAGSYYLEASQISQVSSPEFQVK